MSCFCQIEKDWNLDGMFFLLFLKNWFITEQKKIIEGLIIKIIINEQLYN